MATYYEILGIDSTATALEIDQAYRFLAQKFHPDVNPDAPDFARKRFQTVQEAFETLSDSEKRREYDKQLNVGLGPEWQAIKMNTDNGGVRFNSDGSLSVAGNRIGPEEAIPKKSIGPATIEKEAGVGGEFRVWRGGKEFRFRFAGGLWHAKRDRPEAAAKPTAAPQKAATSGSSGVPRVNPGSPPIVRPPERRPARKFSYAAVLIGLGLLGGYFASRAGRQLIALTPDEYTEQKEKELLNRQKIAAIDAKLQDQASDEAISGQLNALAKASAVSAKRIGDATLQSVEALSAEIEQWDNEIPPLLENEDGKRLATNEKQVRVFKTLTDKTRPSRDDVAALQLEVETLLVALEEALASGAPTNTATESILEGLAGVEQEALGQLAMIRQTRKGIQSLLATAGRRPPSALTLDQAIAALDLEDTQREVDLIAETEKEARESATTELLAARRALVEAEEAKKRIAVESQTANVRAATQHARNIEEAKATEVQNALRFFITKGFYQPGDSSDYTKTTEARPISYSKLVAYGALEPSDEGMARLLFIVTNFPDDRRTRWKMDRYIGSLSPDDTEKLAKTQDYLRRLGDALVELKLLDP
jgi:hypothetical protein